MVQLYANYIVQEHMFGWVVEKIKLKVPLQTLSLQDLVSVRSPEQGYDPEQVRVLDCVPVPHVRLHVLHALQADHTANKTNQITCNLKFHIVQYAANYHHILIN